MMHIGSTPAHSDPEASAGLVRRLTGSTPDQGGGLAEQGFARSESAEDRKEDAIFVSPPPMPWPRVFPPL